MDESKWILMRLRRGVRRREVTVQLEAWCLAALSSCWYLQRPGELLFEVYVSTSSAFTSVFFQILFDTVNYVPSVCFTFQQLLSENCHGFHENVAMSSNFLPCFLIGYHARIVMFLGLKQLV